MSEVINTENIKMQKTKGMEIHAEVCLRSNVRMDVKSTLEAPLRQYIVAKNLHYNTPTLLEESPPAVLAGVESILLEFEGNDKSDQSFTEEDSRHLVFHMYRLNERVVELEMFDDQGGGDESVPFSNHWLLPSKAFVGLWDSLIYDDNLKENTLKFALSALMFSQHNVNPNIITCNRLILLHGPPGTGKTSLCKAIAQKLAIRTSSLYRHTHLIEINSHSIFSKWFSESAKLVMKLFARIREIIADPNNLVCVLVDEVESLAYARDCMSSQEPKDAMRVVNALLTQLDSIKEYPNVLLMSTSNLASTIDLAFLDRADIKQYIGLPSISAIAQIFESILLEMMRVGMVKKESISAEGCHMAQLMSLAQLSVGLSGRMLRKLPFLAHAMYNTSFYTKETIKLTSFLDAMRDALRKHHNDQELFKK